MCGTIRKDFNPNNVAMGLLVSVHNINLDLESNGHMVPLSTSITFELYNCLTIYNYYFQVIDSMCFREKKSLIH